MPGHRGLHGPFGIGSVARSSPRRESPCYIPPRFRGPGNTAPAGLLRRFFKQMLDVQGLRKSFYGTVAVDDATFKVESGEILGLLCLNCAGKSDAVRVCVGVMTLC